MKQMSEIYFYLGGEYIFSNITADVSITQLPW